MKIAIVGGGFTGLSAAFTLTKLHHRVTIFEKEKTLGGLAAAVKLPGWEWHLEQHYHHWFTNDAAALNLIKELGLWEKFLLPTTLTSLFYKGHIYPFNSPAHILSFSPLSISDRIRLGAVSLLLKIIPEKLALQFEKITAYEGAQKYYGKRVFDLVWKPLLTGKFGPFAKTVNMAWFWARIKKRTLKLGYLQGGYQQLVDALDASIKKQGGIIHLQTPFDPAQTSRFDKVIITAPSPLFLHLYPHLPSSYKQNIMKIPHLHALNLILVSKEKYLEDTYWLSISDETYPFLALVQQTNLADSSNYAGNHLLYIANYLPPNHPYLKMSKEELFAVYKPYLQRINPSFQFPQPITHHTQLFFGPFAQPVFPINYSHIKPEFVTPIPHVYLANMDMVYPWDRGTNYAIEMGQQVAKHILDKR